MMLYAGLDVSDKSTHLCVVDGEGAVVRRDVVASDPDVLAKWLKRHVPDLRRVVLETGITVPDYGASLLNPLNSKARHHLPPAPSPFNHFAIPGTQYSSGLARQESSCKIGFILLLFSDIANRSNG
jgi:hypothetical protein